MPNLSSDSDSESSDSAESPSSSSDIAGQLSGKPPSTERSITDAIDADAIDADAIDGGLHPHFSTRADGLVDHVDRMDQEPARLSDSSQNDPFADSPAKLERCEEILDYRFQDQALLHSALTHASGAAHRLASNERLEFLGDAVLGLVVCQWLFEEYPEYSEGDLTKIKSAVVSRRACGKAARKLGLDQCLIVGRGVTKNRSFPKSLVSDVFESVIAALYLDGGADVVRDRLKAWLLDEVQLAVESQGSGNHKSVLQQYAQRELTATPIYRLIRETGPDHRKAFLMGAQINDRSFPPAWGNNKKDAEQRAAANALAELHSQAIPYTSETPTP